MAVFRVHERGQRDSMLYNITLLIILVGGVEWCKVVYTLAYPAK